uniref:Uncharacterized protein n=1 Tax=Cacopsylla melanoneura TaxID=428564 RepID=A0A8D8U9R5_9HEMI
MSFCLFKNQSGILYCLGLVMMVMILSTSSSEHSPALLFRSMSAFFSTMLENLLPQPLMAVRANMTFLFPSMFVDITRRMCWNFSGITRDILAVKGFTAGKIQEKRKPQLQKHFTAHWFVLI